MPTVNDLTKQSLPLTLAVSLVVSAITGTGAAVTSAYSLRDAILSRVSSDIDRSAEKTRREWEEQLHYYLSKEAFFEWRQQERIRQDRQFYQLLNAIERLSGRLQR
jgi:hypothetical protein